MADQSSFRNEPLKDFSEEHNRRALVSALEGVRSVCDRGGFHAAPIVGGETIYDGEEITSRDPSDLSQTLGTVRLASTDLAQRAVTQCAHGFAAWRATPHTERARIIRSVANRMREKRDLLSALIIREVGKPWREADADVAEAIDFCDYYADEMLRFGTPQLTDHVLGEENTYFYQPRGVVAIIAPWNFPLAIACGMTVAALVTGNTAILKPAEQSSLIGAEFARILLECGIPHDAFAFLPGRGETVGDLLVKHPAVAMIVFTGSRPVGLSIIREAANVSPGQRCIKRVVAELGGKNAIIVDDDADFDDAIRGVVASAFGFAGQKCSACSRLIVVGSAYEPFLERLRSATLDLIIGPASDPASFLGPVIDTEARDRINATIAHGRDTLNTLVSYPLSEELAHAGSYVPPTIFRDVPLDHPIWKEEIFGPVVACVRADSFEHALNLATESEYALTGGVFSRSPKNIARARAEFRVGNLYINRSITGALVKRQPFGGFAFSGIGSKAGGPDYLLQFTEPRVISENTMRRGFSPDVG
jgi:RHH-type proline utilization regulon transcriptional repressor/proline dehydrogenase/delta 1-pyrroline-5-carboxylate dehydrogenase